MNFTMRDNDGIKTKIEFKDSLCGSKKGKLGSQTLITFSLEDMGYWGIDDNNEIVEVYQDSIPTLSSSTFTYDTRCPNRLRLEARPCLNSINLDPYYHDHVINTLKDWLFEFYIHHDSDQAFLFDIHVRIEYYRVQRIIREADNGDEDEDGWWKAMEALETVNKGEGDCAICIQELCSSKDDYSIIVKLPSCIHVFHQDCISQWFKKRPSCPLCRSNCLLT